MFLNRPSLKAENLGYITAT